MVVDVVTSPYLVGAALVNDHDCCLLKYCVDHVDELFDDHGCLLFVDCVDCYCCCVAGCHSSIVADERKVK